jgi:hypothetical protein
MNSFTKLFWLSGLSLAVASGALVQSQQLSPAFAGKYQVALLGPSPENSSYGSFVFRPGDPNTVALSSTDALVLKNYSVLRDPNGLIIGLSDTGLAFAQLTHVESAIWLGFAPNGTLFARGGFDTPTIGQVKPGESDTASVVKLVDLGLSTSGYSTYGQTLVVPTGFPGAGSVKFLTGDTWHGSSLNPQPDGTYSFGAFTSSVLVLDDGDSGQGFVFVPAGYPGFSKASVLISDSSNSSDYAVYAFELDANGDPVASTRRVFMTRVSDLCDLDPVTGDLLIRAGDPVTLYAIRRSVTQNPAPEIAIETPEEGSTVVAGERVDFVGKASQVGGTITQISLLQNGTEVDITKGPFSANPVGFFLTSRALSLPGSYTFNVVAVGGDGMTTTSGPVHLNVITKPNQRPVVSLDLGGYPGQVFYSCQPVPVSLSAFDPDGTISSLFLLDGSQVITRLGSQSRFQVRELGVGKHTLTHRAADNLGAISTATLEVTVLAPPPGVVTGGFGYDGLYRVCFSGTPGLNYVAEVSPDLSIPRNWVSLPPVQPGSGALLVWTDSQSGTNKPPRFYRIRRP